MIDQISPPTKIDLTYSLDSRNFASLDLRPATIYNSNPSSKLRNSPSVIRSPVTLYTSSARSSVRHGSYSSRGAKASAPLWVICVWTSVWAWRRRSLRSSMGTMGPKALKRRIRSVLGIGKVS